MRADTKPWVVAGTSPGTRILPNLGASADLLIGLEFSVTVLADGSNGLLVELRTIVQELGLGSR